ncbi:hypothetical protein NXS19_006361 [Fusarium pseudograminearum]|nr:hypothetical protein NXS19_006361 [Fusarium pseudograminearum]
MWFLFSVSYVFGVFFISILGSKLLHLWTHFFTVPASAFFLYLPTFFLFDLLTICIGRMLLAQSKTPWAWITSLIGSIATYVFFFFFFFFFYPPLGLRKLRHAHTNR